MKPDNVTVLARSDYFIADVTHREAVEMVERWHYAKGASNTSVYRHGLFRHDSPDDCRGVAMWLPPTKNAALTVHDDWRRVLALTRLAIHPDEPQNAASFLMARSIREIRKKGDWAALVTYADEGQGHTGAIYKATNWEYRGARRGDQVWLDADGRQVSRKAGPTSRTAGEMEALGYVRSGVTRKHKFVMYLGRRPGLMSTGSGIAA